MILFGAVLLITITITALYVVFQQNWMILLNNYNIKVSNKLTSTKDWWCSTPDGSIKNDNKILKKLKNNPNTRLETWNTDEWKNTVNCAVTFNKKNGNRYVAYGKTVLNNSCCFEEKNNLPDLIMNRAC